MVDIKTNLSDLPTKIENGKVTAIYQSSNTMKATVKLSKNFNASSSIVVANPLVASQTPYSSTTGVVCQMTSSNSIDIYVYGGGFVNGHVLVVAYLVVEK